MKPTILISSKFMSLNKRYPVEGLILSCARFFLSTSRISAAFICFFFILSSVPAQTLIPYSYTGAVQSFTVPACVHSLHIKAWGGGASGGGTDSYNGAAGGGGAFVQTDIAVTPGQVLTIIVGGGGGAGQGCVTGTGGGAPGWGNGIVDGAAGGNAGGSGCSGGGGGGGGGTGIFNGATPMAVAGGGGGGSGGGQFSSGALGGGGGVNGNSVAGSCSTPGLTGASGNGLGTVGANKGGADGGGGGGGGGGYLGGTGGGIAGGCDCGACGGGGGSSWSGGINTTITNGNGQTPGNNTDPDLPAGDAGGGGGSTSGGNGFLELSYATPIPITASVSTYTNPTCFNAANGTITASASGGNGTLSYSWTPSGQTTLNITALVAGSYTLTVTDGSGCPVTTTQTLTQPTVLSSTISGIAASCFGKCDGQTICIPNGGTTPYAYTWNGGCAQASCNNVCAGSWVVTITDAKGCIKKDSTVVTQPTALALTVTSQTAHCSKPDGSATASVTGGTGAPTYTWTPAPGSGAATYTGITPGTYTILVHDTKGCADSTTIVVNNIPGVVASIPSSTNPGCNLGTNGTATATATSGSPTYTFSWNPAPATGQNTANAGGLGAGTYTCTVTDSAGCINTATIVITQPTPVTVAPMAPATICISQCLPLTATGAGGTPGYTYTWVQGTTPVTPPVCPAVTTTYTVVATDGNACVSSPKLLTITVNPPLSVTTFGGTSVCPGFSATLGATGSGGDGTWLYSWSPPTGLSNPLIANPVATPPSTTTTYTVTVSDNCGTPTDSATVTVVVYPAPITTIYSNDTAGCPPLCISFSDSAAPACQTATWTYGDGTTFTGCAPHTHCYTTTGLYSVGVHVTDIHGCKTSALHTNMINVYPVPVALFTPTPQPTTILNPGITFVNNTADTSCTWQWLFIEKDTTTSILQTPSLYTYIDTGCYPVRLVATNNQGCRDTLRKIICIDPVYTFYAPNTFTPNDDGHNEIWVPQGEGIDLNNYSLRIWDRWGNLVFSTTTWGQGWDGRANNGHDKAQIDIYVWQVDLKDFSRQPHHYKGIINLMK
jgi:gliding motility-associated-like protein